MLFKNEELNTGDVVVLQTSSVPLPEFQAAVIDVKDGILEVLSTFLVPFNHDGNFTESEVGKIKVVYPAEVAIPREARGKGFAKGAYVASYVEGKGAQVGRVVAAFDGLLVARREDGEFITGGANFFEEIPKWRLIDTKMMTIGPINKLMKEARITEEDVRDFYVMSVDGKSGQIMTYDEMFALDIEEIGGWSRISELDVNC